MVVSVHKNTRLIWRWTEILLEKTEWSSRGNFMDIRGKPTFTGISFDRRNEVVKFRLMRECKCNFCSWKAGGFQRETRTSSARNQVKLIANQQPVAGCCLTFPSKATAESSSSWAQCDSGEYGVYSKEFQRLKAYIGSKLVKIYKNRVIAYLLVQSSSGFRSKIWSLKNYWIISGNWRR